MEPNGSTCKPEAGNQQGSEPLGRPDPRIGEMRANRNINGWETTKVPSKTGSEGQI